MNIYQIKSEYLHISEMLQENGGELTDEIKELLTINEKNLIEKSTNYCAVIKKLQSESEIIESEIKRLDDLKKKRDKTVLRLKENVLEALKTYEKQKIETPLFEISIKKTKSVEVYDIDLLPNNCKKIEVKHISKTEIRKLIESGEEIKGAKIVENNNLIIK